MKAMSIVLKALSLLGFAFGALAFFNAEIEASIISVIAAVLVLATGVLFRNLAEVFRTLS
jgi:hypothetical protein